MFPCLRQCEWCCCDCGVSDVSCPMDEYPEAGCLPFLFREHSILGSTRTGLVCPPPAVYQCPCSSCPYCTLSLAVLLITILGGRQSLVDCNLHFSDDESCGSHVPVGHSCTFGKEPVPVKLIVILNGPE